MNGEPIAFDSRLLGGLILWRKGWRISRGQFVKYSKLVKREDRLKKPSEILFRGLEGLEGWKLRKSQALSWQG